VSAELSELQIFPTNRDKYLAQKTCDIIHSGYLACSGAFCYEKQHINPAKIV
jgi:hypothetical protein